MAEEYTAQKITVLKGLDAVRKRPAMYIGSTDIHGLHHLIYEVVDNSIDEAMAGYCTEIDVVIREDGSVSVTDNGRGIPVDIHPTQHRPAVEVVMTTLHAGGKFDDKSYRYSGGLHGVGVSVVNALSEYLEVESRRDGRNYFQRYERGVPTGDLQDRGPIDGIGTMVTFHPDLTIFGEIKYSFETLTQRLRELAFLNRGLRITLVDQRASKEKKHIFQYEGGIVSFVKYLDENKKNINAEPIYVHSEKDGVDVEAAIQYNDGYVENVFAFANNINTMEGGTHLSGFRSALTRTFNNYAQANGLFKKDKFTLSGEDVREGLTAVVSVKLKEPQFEGQTKTKLGNSEVKGIVDAVVSDGLKEFLEENPAVAKHDGRKVLRRFQGARGGAEGARSRAAQIRSRVLLAPGEARRLFERGPRGVRALPRRGRFGGRLREAGEEPRVPGDPPAPRQDPQRREGAARQDPLERRNQDDHHRDRHRSSRGGIRSLEDPLQKSHHHDRCRRRRRAHPYALAHPFLPVHAETSSGRGSSTSPSRRSTG